MSQTSEVATPTTDRADRPGWSQRTWPSMAVLAILLFGVAQLGDPDGYLSTDVGGKTATIQVIVDDGPRAPDLGYWAESADEDGSLYPMWSTAHIGDAWVNVTTLPMLYVAAPFWALGGARLALLVPVAGTVAAAAAAAALARRLGGGPTRTATAFWLVGLASPATIYALDLWEHSIGLALIAWGVVAVVDASGRGRVGIMVPLLGGLAFSVAASMRQEAMVYGFIAGAVLVARLLGQRRPAVAAARGIAMVVGTVAGLVANATFEWWVFGTTLRAGRGGGTAAAAGADLVVRIEEAIVTAVGPMAGTNSSSLLLAGVLCGILVAIGVRADRPFQAQWVLWVGLGAVGLQLLLDLLIDGLRFVPGMIATTPLAALGLVRGWEPGPRRMVSAIAVGALPVVWLTQFAGGASAQWGGRYTLASGLLLLVVAVVTYDEGQARRTMRAVAAVGAAVTLVGVTWTVVRTNGVGEAARTLAARPEDALVFHDPFLAREPGPLALDRQWLAAPTQELLDEAAAVLRAAEVEQVGYVDYDIGRAEPVLAGYRVVEVDSIPLVNDLRLRVVSLERTP